MGTVSWQLSGHSVVITCVCVCTYVCMYCKKDKGDRSGPWQGNVIHFQVVSMNDNTKAITVTNIIKIVQSMSSHTSSTTIDLKALFRCLNFLLSCTLEVHSGRVI